MYNSEFLFTNYNLFKISIKKNLSNLYFFSSSIQQPETRQKCEIGSKICISFLSQ